MTFIIPHLIRAREPYKSSPKHAKNYFISNSILLNKLPTIIFIISKHISSFTMSTGGAGVYQNKHGQGMSHATGPSKVPEGIARLVPKGLEESLPNSVCQTSPICHTYTMLTRQIHPTGTDMGQSPDKTHAKDSGTPKAAGETTRRH